MLIFLFFSYPKSQLEFGMTIFVTMRKAFFICFLVPMSAMGQVFVDKSEELSFENFYGDCFLAGGMTFTDFDMDGEEDILTPSCSGEPIHVYRGTPDGFVQYSVPAVLTDTSLSKAVYAVDLDNDGDREIFVSNFQSRNRLYWNSAGEYTDVSDEAGLSVLENDSFSATFGDYNLDGYLDIYVVNRSTISLPQSNVLYRNNGDGSFTNMTLNAGVGDITGAGLAVSFFEFNNDGWPDIYIANDKYTGNVLFMNQGDGTFQDVSMDSGTDLAMDGMSVTIGYYNEDNFLDIYATNTIAAGNRLLLSNGDLTYDEVAEEMNVLVNKFCWGSKFIDFDNDMDEDLFVPSSGPMFDNENTFFMRYQDDLIDWSEFILADDFSESMGSAKADFDHDGDYDLAVLNGGMPGSYLLENQSDPSNFINFSLEGSTSNYEGIGSFIEVHAGGVIQRRYTTLGSDFAAQDSRYHLFGLGASTSIDLIRIIWPSGIVQEVIDQEINVSTCFEEPLPSGIGGPSHSAHIWPIPAEEFLNVRGISGLYRILDSEARVLLAGDLKAGSIDVTSLSSGVYFLESGSSVHRFIKQ